MCEYCDCNIDNGISIRGKKIAEGGYEECYLKKDSYDDEYRIEVLGDGRGQSHPIICCPMCERDLRKKDSMKQMSQEFHEFVFESITAGTEEIIRETNAKVAGNNIENRTTLDEVGTEYFYECMKLAENVIKSFEKYPNENLKE